MLKFLSLTICSFIFLFFANVFPASANMFDREYHYSIDLGYPEKYPIIFDSVYLFSKDKITLYVSTSSANPGPWGSGAQASSILDSQPLPTRIKMQWFSVSENQFWEVDAPIDQTLFKKERNYRLKNPFNYFKTYKIPSAFMSRTYWTIYAIPGGRAFIWMSGGDNTYESFLIADLQAKKVDMDWKGFLLHSDEISKNASIPSRESFVQEKIQKAANKTRSLPQDLINKNADQWLGYIKKYNWQLQMEPPYELKDVEARYTNKEARIILAGTDQTKLMPRPIPSILDFFAVNTKTNYLNRIHINFGKDFYQNHDDDWHEIVEAFEKINQLPPVNGLITLSLKISPDQKQMDIFLIKGKNKIELNDGKVELIDTYDDYNPVVCDLDPPALQMTFDDFTKVEQGSKLFNIQDQDNNPIPYYKYKLLREDGKFYYGVTGLDGKTARVKTFVNGKWLNLDLYEDLRERCVSATEIPKDLHIYKPVSQPYPYNPLLLIRNFIGKN